MKKSSVALILAVFISLTAYQATGANILYSTSSPTSWVGYNGQTISLTPPSTLFTAELWPSNIVTMSATYKQNTNSYLYMLQIIGPDRSVPTVGFYPGAINVSSSEATPGLRFMSPYRSDNNLTGYFNVLQAVYDGTRVVSFAVDFMQYDEGVEANWVSGSFRYNSDIPVPEPATIALLAFGGLMLRKRKG